MHFDVYEYEKLCNRSDEYRDKYIKLLSAATAIYDLPEEVKDTDRGLYEGVTRFLEENLNDVKSDMAWIRNQQFEMLIG